jgi:glutamate synthase (ferredoxin)
LISEHKELTGSKRAEDILLNWDRFIKKFIKILPQDYERVLLALKRAEERGLKGDEAVQAAFEENVAAGN